VSRFIAFGEFLYKCGDGFFEFVELGDEVKNDSCHGYDGNDK
jgi:hypothetical protein